MEITLVRFKDDGERRDFRVKSDRCLIGRQATCDLPIPLSSISREHCVLEVKNGAASLRDLDSRNGTFRNEEKLEGEVELSPGDRIAVGPIVFTVQINGEPEHIEPPLMDAPTISTAKPNAHSAGKGGKADDSAGDLSDLIRQVQADDSSVFDLDMYLDDDEDEEG